MTSDSKHGFANTASARLNAWCPHERIIRGKVVPAQKFLEIERNQALRIPSSVFLITVTGDYPTTMLIRSPYPTRMWCCTPISRRSASPPVTEPRPRSSSPTRV